ncbi:MAG: PLDc N-terminal domain-containing protein [Clostridia bacterium]|nr:PLDc N-terminal domain-containing protein [Clostridia bacterium]
MENKNYEESKGIRLLHRGRSGFLSIIFSRAGLIALLLIIQFGVLAAIMYTFETEFVGYYGGALVVSLFMVLYLLNTPSAETTKITWIIIVMVLPVFGTLLYVYTKLDVGHRAQRARVDQVMRETSKILSENKEVISELESVDEGVASLARYINRNGCHPVYKNTDVTYFPIGEAKFEEMLRQLELAEKYIYAEYFIVDEGFMWGRVLEVLAKKAAEGVDVRVMYDGTCELSVLPIDYPQRLKKLGIKCKAFHE